MLLAPKTRPRFSSPLPAPSRRHRGRPHANTPTKWGSGSPCLTYSSRLGGPCALARFWQRGRCRVHTGERTVYVKREEHVGEPHEAVGHLAWRGRRLRNAECGMRNAECGMRNPECGMQNAKCKLRLAGRSECLLVGPLAHRRRAQDTVLTNAAHSTSQLAAVFCLFFVVRRGYRIEPQRLSCFRPAGGRQPGA